MFITFEGLDGSGKSTQVKLLTEYLRGRGYAVTQTREPGGTPLAEELRAQLLMSARENTLATMLVMAGRKDHVDQLIAPKLLEGDVVISDRYYDSSIAMQGFANGKESLERVLTLINLLALPTPDLTFLFMLPEKTQRERLSNRTELDHFEASNLEYHRAVRAGFKWARQHGPSPQRFRLIDASRSIKEMHAQVVAEFEAFLNEVLEKSNFHY